MWHSANSPTHGRVSYYVLIGLVLHIHAVLYRKKMIDKLVLSFWNLKLSILNDAKMNLQAFKAIHD